MCLPGGAVRCCSGRLHPRLTNQQPDSITGFVMRLVDYFFVGDCLAVDLKNRSGFSNANSR